MRSSIALILLLAAPAAAQTVPAQPAPVAPGQPAVEPGASANVPADSDEARFEAWLSQYRAGAIARGLKPEWLDATLAGVTLSPRVVQLDRAQPDDSNVRSVFSNYRARMIDDLRIRGGQRRLQENAPLLAGIQARTSVPGAVAVAIWGIETSYGANTGGFDLPRSLATLAFDGRRAALFTRELDAAVRMVGERGTPRERLRGSWAGATGQPQFLPSTYLAHAADGDGDGVADIWTSAPDTLASIANYLRHDGWRAGGAGVTGWGFAVSVPAALDRERVRDLVQPRACIRPLSRHSRWLTMAEWRALGVQPLTAAPPADDALLTLIEPDGPGGAAFLTTGNYRAILGYNCSNFYALTVGLLADAIARPPEPAPEPGTLEPETNDVIPANAGTQNLREAAPPPPPAPPQ